MVERFMSKVEVPEDGNLCWNWKGSTIKGYGQFWKDGTNRLAHRVSYEYFNGFPADNMVIHSCDNPLCVNPAHLRDGTSIDNMRSCKLCKSTAFKRFKERQRERTGN